MYIICIFRFVNILFGYSILVHWCCLSLSGLLFFFCTVLAYLYFTSVGSSIYFVLLVITFPSALRTNGPTGNMATSLILYIMPQQITPIPLFYDVLVNWIERNKRLLNERIIILYSIIKSSSLIFEWKSCYFINYSESAKSLESTNFVHIFTMFISASFI